MSFDWNDVYSILLAFFTICFWEFIKWVMSKRTKTYKWKCSVCGFKVVTDSPSTFMVSTTSHNHASLGEYKP